MSEIELNRAFFYQLTIYLGLILVIAFTLVMGYTESSLNNDFLHWGIVYASAYDLTQGALPYRETYDIYGLLSSVLNALAMIVFDSSLVTLGVFNSILYAFVFYVSFLIWQALTDKDTALVLVVAQLIFHPFIFYPWPNYPAYLFMLVSIWCLMRRTPWGYLLAGIFVAASLMSRFSMVIIVLFSFSAYFLSDYFNSRDIKAVTTNLLRTIVGGCIVFVPFLGFLLWNGLFADFIRNSVVVPDEIVEAWVINNGIDRTTLLRELALAMFSLADGNMLVNNAVIKATMLITNYCALFVILRAAYRWSTGREQSSIELMLAVTVLAGYLTSIHLLEPFRIATSSFIGFILIPMLMREYLSNTPAHKGFFYVVSFVYSALLLPNLFAQTKPPNSIFWSATSAPEIMASKQSNPIELIDGKSWPANYRYQFESIAANIQHYRELCEIESLVNLTENPTLQYLVPDMKKVQRESSRLLFHYSDRIFPEEPERRATMFANQNLLALVPIESKADWGIPNGYGYADLTTDAALAVPPRCINKAENN